MNSYFKHIFILILLSVFVETAVSQSNEFSVGVQYYQDGMVLQTLPSNPAFWLQNRDGVDITRFNYTDSTGRQNQTALSSEFYGLTPDLVSSKLSESCQKDIAMKIFELIEDPNAFLDTTGYSMGNDSVLDKKVFDYIFYELTNDPVLAEVFGFGILDTSLFVGYHYIYEIRSKKDGSLITTFETDSTFNFSDKPLKAKDLGISLKAEESISNMLCPPSAPVVDVLFMVGKAYGDSIVLRWAPNSPSFWDRATKAGYALTREIVGSNDTNDYKLIADHTTNNPVFPLAPDSIPESFFDGDSVAMAAASLLKINPSSGLSPVTSAAEYENRYAIAMLASEQSFKAAQILGLAFVDKDIEHGVEYMYSLSTPAGDMFSWTSATVTNTYEKPAPPEFVFASGSEHNVTIQWPRKQKYTFYHIERSDDEGTSYNRLTKTPQVFLETDNFKAPYCIFVDSVPELEKTYFYRVIGINSFGEESEPAMVSAVSKDATPPQRPLIDSAAYLGGDSIYLKWSAVKPDDGDSLELLYSPSYVGPFERSNIALDFNKKAYHFNIPQVQTENARYFVIRSYDNNLNSSESLPKYVNIPDSVAPEPVANMRGQIDSAGVLALIWSPSVSRDVEEYYVYSTIDTTEEFIRVNAAMQLDTFFVDTVEAASMNEVIYLGVVAVDAYYNRSAMQILPVKRVDFIAPPAPVFDKTLVQDDGVYLSWKRSSAADIKSVQVLKEIQGDSNIYLLRNVPSYERSYKDTAIEAGERYTYYLVAEDDAENFSDTSIHAQFRIKEDKSGVVISNFDVAYNEDLQDVTLSWDFNTKLPKSLQDLEYNFEIMKSYGSETPIIYEVLPSSETTFSEKGLDDGTLQNYAVRIAFGNGFITNPSPVKSIQIK